MSTNSPEATKKMARPIGVTILAILQIIMGIIFLIGATGSMVILGMMGNLGIGSGGVLSSMASAISALLIILAIVEFVIAYGFLQPVKSARLLGLIFAVIDLIVGILALPGGIITILIGAVILST